ncbi:LysM peptidoglycan-binding domain-containing protein [Burkholderia ambifaria]|uniref:hypothetical protein n=1 Tax=Burkholderia ambifaria TaxID=152480 RepID=UPI001F20B4D5|nr:hypothetical protein [Burkholderia ambifaria]
MLARAGRALFDANPQAFMKRDPSRLKVGATLTVPALDATGAALVPAGASSASGASAVSAPAAAAVAASGTAAAAVAQHGASAPHPGSAVQSVPAASAAHAAPASSASVAVAAGASAPIGASAAHGASTVEPVQPAAPAAGASGPHVWSGAIQSAPSSASDAAAQVAPGGAAQGMHEPSAAAPVAGASQPRPSSLQQLLALKNRVLMELQKHGIGKPAHTKQRCTGRARRLRHPLRRAPPRMTQVHPLPRLHRPRAKRRPMWSPARRSRHRHPCSRPCRSRPPRPRAVRHRSTGVRQQWPVGRARSRGLVRVAQAPESAACRCDRPESAERLPSMPAHRRRPSNPCRRSFPRRRSHATPRPM